MYGRASFIFAVIHIGQRPATVCGPLAPHRKWAISCATLGLMFINECTLTFVDNLVFRYLTLRPCVCFASSRLVRSPTLSLRGNVGWSAVSYLLQAALCGRGAGAVVLRSHWAVPRPFQEVLSGSGPPGVPDGLGPLQSVAQLLGHAQVLLMLLLLDLDLDLERIPA